MNNIFANEYEAERAIKARYEAAEQAQDEAGKEAARMEHRAHQGSIAARGNNFKKVYSLYSSAQERGNEFIDINEIVWDDQVENTVATLREHGVERFTISGTWSSIIETVWLFSKAGCTLEGVVELNDHFKSILTGDYEKIHGLLFRAN